MKATGLVLAAWAILFVRVSAASDWAIDMVDQSGISRFSSLKIDTEGNVHVAYVVEDGNRYPLKYAFWDHKAKRWFTMPVAEAASFCSLALDSKQRPHISWADHGTGSGAKLRYAYWDGSWKRKQIALTSDVIGYYTSIALDPQDRPRISFYEYRGPVETDFKIRLRVVMWNGEHWEVSTVDGQEGSGKFNALAADAQGHLHAGYANVSAVTAGMRYGFWDGNSWHVEILEGLNQSNQDYVGFAACIALDKQGNPHVTYMNETTPMVKYAARKNGKWVIQAIDRLASVGYPDRNAIALDETDRPFIGYYDAGRGFLKVAYQQGQRWIAEIVDRNRSGFNSSLQVDHGVVWISYADDMNGGLKVAHAEIVAQPEKKAESSASASR